MENFWLFSIAACAIRSRSTPSLSSAESKPAASFSFISVCHWAKISLFSGIRLLLTQIFQRIAYHKWIKENRLPHAVVRKGQTERFLSYGESYKLYGAFRFLQYILQCYNFACSNRYIMQRLYLFLRLICAYLIAVVLIPVAWICKLFRR